MGVGTPLFAARGGQVVKVGWGLLGIRVGQEVDFYLHIDRSLVQLGALVQTGRQIAYSGNKVPGGGATTGPHLHFERQSGSLNFPATSLDPEPILTGRFSSGSGSRGEDDMTPQQDAFLSDLHAAVSRLEVALGTADPLAGVNPAPPNYLGWSRQVTALLEEIKAAPGVALDPTLAGKIDRLSQHLGVGNP